jgi:Zn-finger nucleic acid-binding protein
MPMNCPTCEGVELKMSDRRGIEIDYCPKCRGVWLDRGELDKIIERSVPDVRAPEPERRERDDDYDRERYDREGYYRKHKRRGGFLGDLFDFD